MSGRAIDVIIIGGGAAGLTAAISASHSSCSTAILERKDRVGKKLLATGNGRCNFTNIDMDISHFHGQNPKFAHGVLSRFNNMQVINFFESLGIVHVVEDEGKVFPRSGQASSILDVLRFEAASLGVKEITDEEIIKINPVNNKFKLETSNNNIYEANTAILAAGGKSAPELGSNGSGFELAKKLGHKITPFFPALTKIKIKKEFLKQVDGIKIFGTVKAIVDNKVCAVQTGEILFTAYGVSGPPVLHISRAVRENLNLNKTVELSINLVHDMDKNELGSFLASRFEKQGKKSLDFSFAGFIKKQLAPVILKEAGISDIKKPAGQITSKEREKISNLLQDWRLPVSDTLPLSQSQVTAGGISVSEINPKTMESKIVPGLFFAGEIIDIDGDSGGYNLQWAWSSGYIAGKSAAEKI